MMPVMGLAIIESIDLLSASVKAFINFCALDMEANRPGVRKTSRVEHGDGNLASIR